MPEIAPLLSTKVELRLNRAEFETVSRLAFRFGTSRAAVARALVREGIRRVEKMGSFTIEDLFPGS